MKMMKLCIFSEFGIIIWKKGVLITTNIIKYMLQIYTGAFTY